jgi:succinoglycan biosynthesis transport protein ExoP
VRWWRRSRAGNRPGSGSTDDWLFESAECQQEFYRISEKLQVSDPAPRSIVVAGVAGGEGSTIIALNLAYAFSAGESKRTLLIDANLRHPALHRMLDLSLQGGVTDWDGVSEPKYQQTAVSASLFVLTAGSNHEGSVWQQWRDVVSRLCERTRNSFDVVVWDAPAIAPYADSLSLARAADGVILVAESDETKVAVLTYAREQIEGVGATLLGVIVNRRGRYIPGWLR